MNMLAVAPEPRSLSRIYRLKRGTDFDDSSLTTYFKMLIDGEVMLLVVSYSEEARLLMV